MTGMKYFQVFVDKIARDKKRVQGLKKRDLAIDATMKCIIGDGAGELGRSANVQRMLVDQGIRWKSSPPRIFQFNGVVEYTAKQLTRIARN